MQIAGAIGIADLDPDTLRAVIALTKHAEGVECPGCKANHGWNPWGMLLDDPDIIGVGLVVACRKCGVEIKLGKGRVQVFRWNWKNALSPEQEDMETVWDVTGLFLKLECLYQAQGIQLPAYPLSNRVADMLVEKNPGGIDPGTDLSEITFDVPILLVNHPGIPEEEIAREPLGIVLPLCIDGWHRVFKAHYERRGDELMAVVIPHALDLECRLYNGPPGVYDLESNRL